MRLLIALSSLACGLALLAEGLPAVAAIMIAALLLLVLAALP